MRDSGAAALVPGLGNQRLWRTVRAAVLVFLIGASLYPVYFIISTSLKDPAQVTQSPLLPSIGSDPVGTFVEAAAAIVPLIGSSVVVSAQTLLINLGIGFFCAYVATYHRFRGRDALFSLMTLSIMVPGILIFVPSYLLVRDLGLLNSSWAMSLPFAAQTIIVTAFLLRSYMRGLPFEVVEAARVDGAAEFRIALRIVLPMTAPIVVATSVINVLFTWNQFLWPLVVNAGGAKTVPVGLAQLQLAFGNDLPTIMAGYLISAIPLVVLFAFCLKYLISGLTSGAVK